MFVPSVLLELPCYDLLLMLGKRAVLLETKVKQ